MGCVGLLKHRYLPKPNHGPGGLCLGPKHTNDLVNPEWQVCVVLNPELEHGHYRGFASWSQHKSLLTNTTLTDPEDLILKTPDVFTLLRQELIGYEHWKENFLVTGLVVHSPDV